MFRAEISSCNFHLIVFCKNEDQKTQKSVRDDSNISSDIKFDKIFETLLLTARTTDELVVNIKNMSNFVNFDVMHEKLKNVRSDLSVKIESVNHVDDALYVNRKHSNKPRLTEDVACGPNHDFDNADSVLISDIKQQLEEEHNKEMSKLREYFQNKCSDLEKQYKEEVFNQRNCMISDPEDEIYETCFQQFNKRPRSADARLIRNYISDEDNSTKMSEVICKSCKNNNKHMLAKQLHRITNACEEKLEHQRMFFEKEKLDELCKMKKEIEKEYNVKINKLRNDLNTLVDEKKFEQAVRNLHREVKEEYNKELVNIKSKLHSDYCNEIKKHVEQNEAQLNLQHRKEVGQLETEWNVKLDEKCVEISQLQHQLDVYKAKIYNLCDNFNMEAEDILGDVITNSALKNVMMQSDIRSQLNQREEMLSVLSSRSEEIKLNYEGEINRLNLKLTCLMNDEISPITDQRHDIEADHAQQSDEVSLHSSVQCTELFSELNSTQELEIADKITEEINKMRDCCKKEVSLLKQRNKMLQNGLLSGQDEKECQTWPADIATLEKLFTSRHREISNAIINDYENKLCELKVYYEEQLSRISETTEVKSEVDERCTQTEIFDMEKMLGERNKLRRLNNKLQYVIKYFTEYLFNCEKELNHSLIDKLIQHLHLPRKMADKYSEYYDLDKEEDLSINHVHLAPNVSGFLRSIKDDDDDLNESTFEENDEIKLDMSILQLELNNYLKNIKDQAAAILSLTNAKNKNHIAADLTFCKHVQDVAIQTDLVKDVVVDNECHVRLMQQEEINIRLCEELVLMKQTNDELKDKIVNLESVEGYGESLDSPLPLDNKFQIFTTTQEDIPDSDCNVSQYLCNSCDGIKDQAKRIIDDLRLQLEAADKKLRNSNKFLEQQITEWDFERDRFDKKIKNLEHEIREKDKRLWDLKEKTKESESDLRTKNNEIINLEAQLQELSLNTEDYEYKKQSLETEKVMSRNKIVSLRDRIDELEKQLADKSQFADHLQHKLTARENEYERQSFEYQNLITEFDNIKEGGAEQLQTLREQHEASYFILRQVKKELSSIENTIVKRTKELEVKCLSPFSDNIILTSPSEDISTSDPIEEYSAASASSTDTLPAVEVPKDFLPCLCSKLHRLYNAEEALMRHVQDQNLCVTKLSNQLEEAHFESSAFQEKLKETTSKLSEAKIKLEEYQHKESKIDSENVSKLNEKLSILQSDLDLKSFLVTQKESKIIELEQKVTNLEDYIKTTEFEIMRKISRDDEVISNLQNKCDELTKEKQKLVALISSYREKPDNNFDLPVLFRTLIDEKNAELEYLEQKVSTLQSQIFTESKTAISRENDKINFDNSEQTDSFRCAAAETETPRFIENITNEFPITKMSPPSDDDNSANSMINMSDIPKAPNFDDVSANLSSMQEPTVDVVTVTDSKNSTAKRVETSSNADDDNNSVGDASNRGMKVQLEEFWTQLLQLKEENSNLKSQLRQAEDLYASLQTRSYNALEEEKVKIFDLERKLKTLLDTKEEEIDSLKIQLKHREESYNEMRNRLNGDLENRNVELVSLKADLKVLRETKDENDNSLVKQLANLQDILTEERNKAITTTEDKLKMLLEVKQENERLKFQLQRTEESSNCVESGLKNDLEKEINIKNNLERKLNSVQTENNELNAILTACKESYRKKEEMEKERNAKLLEIEQSLQVEKDRVRELEMQSETLQREKDSFEISLERTENELQKNLKSLQFERESVQQCQNEISNLRQQMERKKSVRDQSSSCTKESLEDLAEKVQKEVDRAVELDENMLNNLDIHNNYDTILTDSSIQEDIKGILLKALRCGFESLSEDDKITLQLLLSDDPQKEIRRQEFEEQIKHLKELNVAIENKLQYEKDQNEKLTKNISECSNEIKRLNMILRYLEDRSDYFTSKMQEYQSSATEAEIKCTKENTRFLQLEMTFEAEKRRLVNKQSEDAKQLEILGKRITNVSNENIILKQQLQEFQYRIQTLTAELNSARIMDKYNSDTESEINQAINPLKAQLESIEKRCGSIMLQYEKEKNKAMEFKLKCDNIMENNLRLKTELEASISEKQNLEFQIAELKSEINEQKDLNNKLQTKITLAELNEKRIRKQLKMDIDVKGTKLRAIKEDYSVLQLKLEKLDTDYTLMKDACFCSTYESRAKIIISRMLKAESCRRALTWHKYFSLRTLVVHNERKMSPKQKFKSAGICIISIKRIQILIQHRQKNCNFVLANHLKKC